MEVPGAPACVLEVPVVRLLATWATKPESQTAWVPMATVHFAAVTAALLAGWMAARAKV